MFGSIAGLTPTARAFDRLPYRDWNFIDRYIDKARQHGIAIRYTLNQSCVGSLQDFANDWDKKLMADITELHSAGVHEWTVTSPLLVELLSSMFPDDFIEVSTIAEVATAEEAIRWKKLGAKGVNISTSVNREFNVVKQIVGTGMVTAILANEACLYKCPWRRECYNLSSHNSQRSEELFGFYPFRRCNEVRLEHPEEWLMSRLVLPQWMDQYTAWTGVTWFKIAFRTHPKEVALPILRSYMEKMHTGNLLDLWPTISHLGATKEPKDATYIDTAKIPKMFLKHFLTQGHYCRYHTCGVSCKVCKNAYKKTQ